MAAAFVAYSSITPIGGSGNWTTTGSKPAGVIDGDLLLAFVADASDITSSGWTVLGKSTSSPAFTVLYRFAVSEPSSYTFSSPSSIQWNSSFIAAYRGESAGITPQLVLLSAAGSGTGVVTPSVTAAGTGLIVGWAAYTNGVQGGNKSYTGVSAGTLRAQGSGGVATIGAFADQVAAVGTAYTQDFTLTNATGGQYMTAAVGIYANFPPTAPGNLAPSGVIDRTVEQEFTGDFHDVDAGDTMSAYQIRYRVAETDDWTTLDETAATALSHTFAADTFADATEYEWQAIVYDAAGLPGPWSTSAFFTAATAPDPATITDPANGSTVTASTHTLAWTTPGTQVSYEWRRVADDGDDGADTSVVYEDSRQIFGTTQSVTIDLPVNSRTEHVQVRWTDSTGLWSDWTDDEIAIDYTPPATPTVATAVVAATATAPPYIVVTPTFPAATGDEPDVTSWDLYVRTVAGGGDGERRAKDLDPATDTDWADYTAASTVAMQYLVRAFASSNSTSSDSDWSPA